MLTNTDVVLFKVGCVWGGRVSEVLVWGCVGGPVSLTSASQESIRVTATASSMLFSMFNFLQRVARTQRSVVRRSAKLSLQRSQPDTTETWTFCFSLSFSASFFITKWLCGAIPPVQVKTNGLKSPRSTF